MWRFGKIQNIQGIQKHWKQNSKQVESHFKLNSPPKNMQRIQKGKQLKSIDTGGC